MACDRFRRPHVWRQLAALRWHSVRDSQQGAIRTAGTDRPGSCSSRPPHRLTSKPHEPCCPRSSTSRSHALTPPSHRRARGPTVLGRKRRSSPQPCCAALRLILFVSAIDRSVAVEAATTSWALPPRHQWLLPAQPNASPRRRSMAWIDRHALHPPSTCRPSAPAPKRLQ